MIPGLTDTIIDLFMLNCLLAFSAYIVLHGGSFSFAYVAFIGIGGYFTAVTTTEHGMSMATSLLLAPICAGVVALLLARPLERLSGIYLAIVSVSFVGLVEVLLLNLYSITNGSLGIVGIPLSVQRSHLVAAVVIVALAVRQVERSKTGRAIRMTRIDPLVAGAMGVNVPRVKVTLFVVSACMGAAAGVLRAHYFGYVTPHDYSFNLVVLLLAMVIIGGVGSWTGPILGAAIFTFLPEWLREFGEWRDIFTGALLLLIVIVSREGVTGAIRTALYRVRRNSSGGVESDRSAGPKAEEPPISRHQDTDASVRRPDTGTLS